MEENEQKVIEVVNKLEKKFYTCNRHGDCWQAEQEFINKNGYRPSYNFHCHDEECEDCFGC